LRGSHATFIHSPPIPLATQSGGELKDDVNTSKVLFKLVHDAGKAAASKENDGLKRVTGTHTTID